MDLVATGVRLRNLREKRGLSKEEVASANDISVSALTMYELGQRAARDEIKERIANFYGQSIGSLFYNE